MLVLTCVEIDSHQFQESLLNRKLLLSVGFDRLTYQSSPALGKRILSETENVQLWLAVRRDAEKLETAKVTCMFWSAADHRSLEFESTVHILPLHTEAFPHIHI